MSSNDVTFPDMNIVIGLQGDQLIPQRQDGYANTILSQELRRTTLACTPTSGNDGKIFPVFLYVTFYLILIRRGNLLR